MSFASWFGRQVVTTSAFTPIPPMPALQPVLTKSGLLIQETLTTRWETPLPNTRYANRYLSLRQRDRLASGFRNGYPADGYKWGYIVWVPPNSDREQIDVLE